MVLPVEVLTVQAEPLALSSELPGRIEPVRVAEVRARVAGIVVRKRFEEGADVKAGDLLFQIDPAPLKAAVSRAEGELARNRAVLFEAQARVRRYEPLVKIQAVSQQDFDTATADLRSAEAATRTAQADLETARLNLGYASVTAPISGRIGRALVTEGALVGQGEATLMARIQQLDPIYADFTQTAAEALRLREALKKGTLAAGDSQALTLRVEGRPTSARARCSSPTWRWIAAPARSPCAASSPTPTGSCCRACTCAYVRPRASPTGRSWCRNGPCAAPATAAPR